MDAFVSKRPVWVFAMVALVPSGAIVLFDDWVRSFPGQTCMVAGFWSVGAGVACLGDHRDCGSDQWAKKHRYRMFEYAAVTLVFAGIVLIAAGIGTIIVGQ